MKTTIRVSCVDQVLKIVDRPLLASGGLNEAVVAFDFCEKWNGYAKTGVFYRDEDEVYYSILDDDDICVIPWEVYSTPGYFYFTVFGDKGDVRRTTNTVKYKAQKGLAGSDMLPSDPTPGVYDQIMGRLSEIEQGAGGAGSNVNADWIATKELTGGDTVYIPEQKVSGGLWNNLQMSLQPGFAYDVTFNGEVYTCEARADGQGVAIGNNTSMSLNDYPFCISWAGGSAISGMFFKRSDISYPITLKVTDHAYYVYNQLPEEYLPDCVVKSVNGKRPYANGNVEIPTGTVTCVLTVETITIGESGEPVNIPVTGLTLDLASYNAKVGDGFYINPVVIPSNATNKAVTWKSNATNIATVNNSGFVECIAEGSAVITCTTVDGGFIATCSVSVAAESSGEPEVTLSSISATYSGGDVAVGTAVTDLTGIVVTAHYSDGSTATVTDYTLSGTIAEGSNTIAVSYGGKTTTFTVTGIEENTGGGTAGQKIQFSTLEKTSGFMKADGTIVTMGNTYHVVIPYTEGVFISTGTNASWAQTTYPPVLVLDNGEYSLPTMEALAEKATSVGGKYATPYGVTLNGYSSEATVYVSFLAGGTLGSSLETNMDNAGMFYYITGGAN